MTEPGGESKAGEADGKERTTKPQTVESDDRPANVNNELSDSAKGSSNDSCKESCKDESCKDESCKDESCNDKSTVDRSIENKSTEEKSTEDQSCKDTPSVNTNECKDDQQATTTNSEEQYNRDSTSAVTDRREVSQALDKDSATENHLVSLSC